MKKHEENLRVILLTHQCAPYQAASLTQLGLAEKEGLVTTEQLDLFWEALGGKKRRHWRF